MRWRAGRFLLELHEPLVMGIVNATPDSFSDGGQHADAASAIRHAQRLLDEGAHILDIGGESTRPGSDPVPLELEWQRVQPVIREVARWGVPLSVDTLKPEIMARALAEGADILNDIWALRQPGALAVAAGHPACGICLMHMHREPRSMQRLTMEGDVLPQVRAFLAERVEAAATAGIARERLLLDPGIGFGKTVEQNFALLARQQELLSLGLPLLAGWSRKRSLGTVSGIEEAAARVHPSVAAALLAVERGAHVLRVHDVASTREALSVWRAMRKAQEGSVAAAVQSLPEGPQQETKA